MKYDLSKYKIDIGGPDGNVFVVISKVKSAIKQIYGIADANKFQDMVFDFGHTYEQILSDCVEFTGIQFVSEHHLPISSDLYEINYSEYL